jgi:hypothetical protein
MAQEEVPGEQRSGDDTALASVPRPDVAPGEKRLEALGQQLVVHELLAVAVRPHGVPVRPDLDRRRL